MVICYIVVLYVGVNWWKEVMRLITDYLPYVASHLNPLNKWHYLTQPLQTWIIIKNNKLQKMLQIGNKTVNIINIV